MEDGTLNKLIDTRSLKVVKDYLDKSWFTARKLTDTPTDSLSVVNRRFVTMNGLTVTRPTSSIVGQFFFDTSLNKPVWYGNSGWVDATGTPT